MMNEYKWRRMSWNIPLGQQCKGLSLYRMLRLQGGSSEMMIQESKEHHLEGVLGHTTPLTGQVRPLGSGIGKLHKHCMTYLLHYRVILCSKKRESFKGKTYMYDLGQFSQDLCTVNEQGFPEARMTHDDFLVLQTILAPPVTLATLCSDLWK